MSDSDGTTPRTPESRVVPRKRTRLSLVWLIPIAAAVVGGWVAVTRILGEGPEITIELDSATGLEAGKTKIEHNGVRVGTVTQIRLSDDHMTAIATVQMAPKTESFLVDDTHFWVVRPRISGASVSGLGTLVSGAYLDVEIGQSPKARRHFVALKDPPVVKSSESGRSYLLKAADLGSLDRGTPIFFRRMQVGEVVSYQLADDGQSFAVKAFVRAPYDQYVTPETRFWHASGIDVALSANGLDVQTESLISILIGGIAFETPASGPALPPAQTGTAYTLFSDRTDAFRPAARDPQTYVAVFDDDVRGLSPGAPVDFRGIAIGEVIDVVGRLNAQTFDFAVEVTMRLDAERFGIEATGPEPGVDLKARRRALVDSLVSRGVRAQLRTGSMLSGALYVALDFFPDARPAEVDWSQQPARLPTVVGQLQAIEASFASIAKKIEQLPIEQIGKDLRNAIVELDKTLVSARATFDNATTLIAPNSVLGQQLDGTLQEVGSAARSVRLLADYLERHPESLIRGKTGEAK